MVAGQDYNVMVVVRLRDAAILIFFQLINIPLAKRVLEQKLQHECDTMERRQDV